MQRPKDFHIKRLLNKTALLHVEQRFRREPIEFLKQPFVNVFKVETRFALHARQEFFRDACQQFWIAVDAHKVIAHVSLADLNPGNGNLLRSHFAAPRSHSGRTSGSFQSIVRRCVLRDRKSIGIGLEQYAKACKHRFEIRRHAIITATRHSDIMPRRRAGRNFGRIVRATIAATGFYT